MKEGRKPEHSEKTPDDELQKMPQTKAPKLKPQPRLEPAPRHWWQARKADVLTITPRVAPTCCPNELNATDETCYPTTSRYADTRPTSPSADPSLSYCVTPPGAESPVSVV